MLQNTSFKVYGMTCTLCSLNIESVLEKIAGVRSISVSYAAERARVSFDDEIVKVGDIAGHIKSMGFTVSDGQEPEQQEDPTLKKLRRLLIASAIFSLPMLLAMISEGAGFCCNAFDPNAATDFAKFVNFLRYNARVLHSWRFQLAAATPVQFIIGFRFYKNSSHALRARRATMDLLVAVGTSVAYFYSLYVSLSASASYTYSFGSNPLGMKNIYFESSVLIITLALFGRYLEALARGRTSRSIRNILSLQPRNARLAADGSIIRAENVQIGDLLEVYPNEQIPVDGVVVEGFTAVDESMLTGEAQPVDKTAGDRVTGASLNEGGSIKMKATQVGEQTVYASIVRLVQQAQEQKAPIEHTVDKVCGIFIPAVFLIALSTFIYWYVFAFRLNPMLIDLAVIRAVSVLVVSCPCALGLATPAAIIVGLGRGAERGILIKKGEVLERLSHVDRVLLDKTGTLTSGRPVLSEIVLTAALEEQRIRELAAVAEKRAGHPVAKAVVRAYLDQKGGLPPDPEEFEQLAGQGVRAKIDGVSVLIGGPALLVGQEVETGELSQYDHLREGGRMLSFVAVSGELSAVLVFTDHLRDGARQAINELAALHIEAQILSGDSEAAAREAAEQAGISGVSASVLPGGKAAAVRSLQKEGHIVAMVGDGINDAPALAMADVGIAVGTGSDTAIEAGDIVLPGGELTAVATAIRLARKTMLKIKLNLFWAFFYNLIAIPVAAAGFLNPTVGALAMSLSSVSVLINSLHLRRQRI